MSAPATLAVVLAIGIPVQVFRAYRLDQRSVERWSRERGVVLTAENHAMVVRYLRRTRVMRTWGAVAGAIVPSLIEFIWSGRVQVLGFGTDGENAPLGFGTIFIGYLLGALCAEVSVARLSSGDRQVASLVPRQFESYLSRRVVLSQRVAAAAGALGLLAIGLVPYGESTANPGWASLAVGAVVVMAFGIGLEAIERWLVRRPQPFTDASIVAADDAIRAQSIQIVAGAGLALLLLFCSGVALGLQASDVRALHSAMVVPAAVCLVLSVVVCRDAGDGAWHVERSPRAGGTASA
jgi:hypothetical protein